MSKKLTPAVGYVRMSSGHQEKSPAQQREEIKKLAVKHGCRIVRWYTDERISGDATEKRKDFQRMIRDAEEKGDFAAILCWDQDRFGRFDSIEAGRWIYPLREAGVWLITVAQGVIDWNDFAGRIVYSIQQEGKYQFLVDLARNALRGQIAAAKRGKSCTRPAYGYDRLFYDEKGEFVRRVPYGDKFNKPRGWTAVFAVSEDPEIVGAVKWMFETFASTDCSLRWLLGQLNERNTPGRPNGWSDKGLKYTLTNPAYIGVRAFGRRATGKYCQIGKDGVEQRQGKGSVPGKAPITIEDAHEPLVDRETFEAVQRKLEERGIKGRRPRFNGYILSGVLRCGHCGEVLAGDNAGVGDGRHQTRYYRCRGKNHNHPECPSSRVRQDAIESYVLSYISDRVCSPATIEAIEQAIHRQAKRRRLPQVSTRSLKAKLAALDKRIIKGTENLLLANAEEMADVSRVLTGWRDDRARLQAELEAMTAGPAQGTPTEKARQAVAELGRLRDHLQAADPMKVRGAVKALIDSITLWWEPDGKRQRVAKGLITEREARGLIRTTSAGESSPCS